VLVYSAGVRTGYSIFCPTCYSDCGKRVLTDAAGRFEIAGLDDELTFNLLVVKDGYAPKWIRAVDPLKVNVPPTAIDASQPVNDPQRVVRGKVIDASGTAMPFALVEADGATFLQDGVPQTMFGGTRDMLAVTNEQGEFDLASARGATKLFLRVSARGKASRLVTANTGLDPKIITVTDGASIRGRVLKNGKPLRGVELGLITIGRSLPGTYPEERVSTDDKGRFLFTNVPPARVWDVYAKMESLAGHGTMAPLQCATQRDGQDVDVGDIRLQKGVTLSGRVELTDGKPVPAGMRLLIQSRGWDSQTIPLGENASFVVHGLMPGAYVIYPAVQGYRTPDGDSLEVLARRDVSNYVVRLEPGSVY